MHVFKKYSKKLSVCLCVNVYMCVCVCVHRHQEQHVKVQPFAWNCPAAPALLTKRNMQTKENKLKTEMLLVPIFLALHVQTSQENTTSLERSYVILIPQLSRLIPNSTHYLGS